jgi:hypothetical protein
MSRHDPTSIAQTLLSADNFLSGSLDTLCRLVHVATVVVLRACPVGVSRVHACDAGGSGTHETDVEFLATVDDREERL